MENEPVTAVLSTHQPLRVVIIGAGIIGASIAYHLSKRHVAITVVERHHSCSGASSHSFAWLNAFGKSPASYHDLNRRSMDMWPRFAQELGLDIGLHWGGELRWESSAEGVKGLQERVAQLQAWGYPSRLIDAAEVRQLEPQLVTGPIAAAAFGAMDGQVEPLKTVAACLQRAQEGGAIVQSNTAVTGFQTTPARTGTSRIQAVRTPHGDIPCEAVVLAAGIDTTALAAMVSVHVPQQESPGVVIRTAPQPRVLRHVSVLHTPPLAVNRPELHLRQGTDGTIMVGQGTQESLNRDDSQTHADELLTRAAHYLPALRGVAAQPVPVGYRPMPLDGLPVLGFAEAVPNLYIALMHSGVTLAPLVGAYAPLEIVDGARVELFASYRPERFTS
jgi:glycine/D-amino acid oxidase-like deaminating enzyme